MFDKLSQVKLKFAKTKALTTVRIGTSSFFRQQLASVYIEMLTDAASQHLLLRFVSLIFKAKLGGQPFISYTKKVILLANGCVCVRH